MVLVLAAAGPAVADPDSAPVELGGFFGAQYLPRDIGIGNEMNPALRPRSAPVFGGRVSIIAHDVAGDERGHLDVGVETELGFAAAFTGPGTTNNGPYFSPVLDWRANVLLRLSIGRVQPHVLLGGGFAKDLSVKSYIDSDIVGEVYWGVGTTFLAGDNWHIRFDLRQDVFPRMGSGTASAFEGTLGLSVPLGGHKRHEVVLPAAEPAQEPAKAEPAAQPAVADTDADHDTIAGDKDKCPDVAEDIDGFEDDDGCPDPDNDTDGIVDADDKCPQQAETVNGFQDKDGCPDELPQAITVAGPALKFSAASAKLDAADETTLKPVIDVMVSNPDLKVEVVGHPEAAGKKGEELAQRRAEQVRWYLIQHGVADVDRLTSKVGDVAAKGGAVIDLQVVQAKAADGQAQPAPAPAPAPATP